MSQEIKSQSGNTDNPLWPSRSNRRVSFKIYVLLELPTVFITAIRPTFMDKLHVKGTGGGYLVFIKPLLSENIITS